MDWFSPEYLYFVITTYGYWAVGMIVALESMRLPVPSETALVLAALYAGRHHDLRIGVAPNGAASAVTPA
jgi:membrane protein DedA with SNARE-associated domain